MKLPSPAGIGSVSLAGVYLGATNVGKKYCVALPSSFSSETVLDMKIISGSFSQWSMRWIDCGGNVPDFDQCFLARKEIANALRPWAQP